MKYKIISNGVKFRIKTKARFWPFWVYVKRYHYLGYTWEFAEWSLREDAESWIADRQFEDAYHKRKWFDVLTPPRKDD